MSIRSCVMAMMTETNKIPPGEQPTQGGTELQPAGFGGAGDSSAAERPIASSETTEGRLRNRRIEFRVDEENVR